MTHLCAVVVSHNFVYESVPLRMFSGLSLSVQDSGASEGIAFVYPLSVVPCFDMNYKHPLSLNVMMRYICCIRCYVYRFICFTPRRVTYCVPCSFSNVYLTSGDVMCCMDYFVPIRRVETGYSKDDVTYSSSCNETVKTNVIRPSSWDGMVIFFLYVYLCVSPAHNRRTWHCIA